MLELRGITKIFGHFQALDDVDFRANAGEAVGLLGENGAGKSTLLGIVSGSLAPTGGELLWHNQPIKLSSPRDATALGIGIVHQHFRLVPSFTVAENVALAAPQAGLLFSQNEWCERIAEWAAQLGWRIDPDKRIEELGVGERQRVEILKAVHAQQKNENESSTTAQLLLLDEPTANLTPRETEDLFEVLGRLKARGCAIVFVSHKLDEVLTLCDRVAVLRHGRLAGERKINQTTTRELAELMVGRALSTPTPSMRVLDDAPACLEVTNASYCRLRDFSLTIRRGEIVGLAGVDGNGQAELVEILSGLQRPRGGSVLVNGKIIDWRHSPIAVIPPDRQHVGLIPEFPLFENLALHPAMRTEHQSWSGFDWKAAQQRTRELMEKFDVRAPQTQEKTPASQLSGGNQQKLVIARALSFPHQVVVAADPTRGLDIAATHFVHEQLRNAAAQGAAVLLISTDLDEVLELSDRIGVLYDGRLLPDENLLPAGAPRENVGRLMGGVVDEVMQ